MDFGFVSKCGDFTLAHYQYKLMDFYPHAEMEISDIDPGPDVAGIQVGQNTIVLPTSDLQDALNYSSGT